MFQHLILFFTAGLLLFESQDVYAYKNWAYLRNANWSDMLWEPSAFVAKSHLRLRSRPEGYQPGFRCAKYVGMSYLDHIRESKQELCVSGSQKAFRRLTGVGFKGTRGLVEEPELLPSQSSFDCYTAPYVPVGFANKASVSLCRSRNMVLNSCQFFWGKRKGTLTKKFPLPARGAVQLACGLVNHTHIATQNPDLQWLNSIHHDVWLTNATRDDDAVRRACAPGSTTLVTTPTLFLMRDRHANYAHEMEAVSMAFSFLAALNSTDVRQQGVQVVIVDQAPPTGFLETWARISHPYRLRILAHDPFPEGTCFRSAFHVYTFAAGIGYNTNSETTRCESPVVTGLSHWLRQIYDEHDPVDTYASGAAAIDGSMLYGMRLPTTGIVMKNVVWLSRRNLEMVRLLLNASVGWKAMRMVRNEDAVVAGLLAAVQEWNAESCLLYGFNRVVQEEHEKSFSHVRPIHLDPDVSTTDKSGAGFSTQRSHSERRLSSDGSGSAKGTQRRLSLDETDDSTGTYVAVRNAAGRVRGAHRRLAEDAGGGSINEHGNDGDEDYEEGLQGESDGATTSGASGIAASDGAAGVATDRTKPNTILLNKLWESNDRFRTCRRTNVLFSFVDGDFNDMPYHQQLNLIFRTGVLAGVHGAGLTHGYFLPPGQSAVLQLLGESFAKVAANNVFRNMAAGVKNFYEDVLYEGVDVNVDTLKAAVKRAMDFVAAQVMDAQSKRNGDSLPIVLDDHTLYSMVGPSVEQCPRKQKQS